MDEKVTILSKDVILLSVTVNSPLASRCLIDATNDVSAAADSVAVDAATLVVSSIH
jgi:hypothetical protein